MATVSTSKFPAKLSEATEAGDKFVNLFYDTFDKRRQVSCNNPPGRRAECVPNKSPPLRLACCILAGDKRTLLRYFVPGVEWTH